MRLLKRNQERRYVGCNPEVLMNLCVPTSTSQTAKAKDSSEMKTHSNVFMRELF